ncbi:LuxR C-terminal-related transcriptional regulator [Micromonospora sp. NPDC047707]|uniref:helix-turn-helix domain-containing protein n=1 Tax=Micromonospora sp. NPDC047707 TaxID=3154498 RepID=UPI0034525825
MPTNSVQKISDVTSGCCSQAVHAFRRAGSRKRTENSRNDDLVGLTPREIEVLRPFVDGCSNRQIASALSIAEKTASVHVLHILSSCTFLDVAKPPFAHCLRIFDDASPPGPSKAHGQRSAGQPAR